MEQTLEAIPNQKIIKEEADSSVLIKAIEKICYSYQPYEYPPLGAWDALDKLSKTIQPENVSESNHYESTKTMVDVCKASSVNFALLCTHTVDMAMKALYSESKLFSLGKWKDGHYFKLNDDERIRVDNIAKEICLATRLLSLSSNKVFSANKQELNNDLLKGKDNYPRTTAGVLNYLQFHKFNTNTRAKPINQGKYQDLLKTVFATDGNKQHGGYNHKSTVRKYLKEGARKYKEEHMWSQCPRN